MELIEITAEKKRISVLDPLLRKHPVTLEVRDPKLPKKKRIEKVFLMIAPVEMYLPGDNEKLLLLSLPGYGAEVIDLTKPIKIAQLNSLGLSVPSCKALRNEIVEVFKLDHN